MSALETRDSAMKLKLQRAQSARERMDAFVDIAQEARRRLSAGIDEVLQEFVMGKTKSAFEDLFRRLARDPFFQVTVSDSRVKYHKPEVDWRAVYKGREFPGEGVFSQGELNSCAIAFFLALATSHPAGLKLLMLDDPVQNMDEMHIEEFGNVLKFLKDDLGWQIVVGLHDQSVYQYLTRQLYPCSEGQSLISYGFEESKDGTRLTKADSVEFNRAALIAEVA
jgi:exonuclease SbcC